MEKENNLTIIGKDLIDDKSIEQIKNCISDDDIAVLTADAHYGYGHPIGGAVAYKKKISISGVGFDIGCGNMAVRTNVKAADLNVGKVMNEIFDRISFGVGRYNNEPVGHEVISKIDKAEFEPQRKLVHDAARQLGTIGSGNHFVDLFRDDEGWAWIGVHFGSRGFGHKTTTGFIAMSQGNEFTGKGKEGSMDAKPILFDTDSYVGQAYISAMQLAGEYASAGRELVVEKVLGILGAEKTYEVHNHHNFAWEEEHFGETYWVVRKGCTPAFPGQQGFIGANMYDTSVIIEGVDTPEAKDALYSTVHGAGRVMSRRKAKGKIKWQRPPGFPEAKKRQVLVEKGVVNFKQVKKDMKAKGIVLIGAGADEAPECYKRLGDVLSRHGDSINILFNLHPIGVAMAGDDVFDPYKD